MPRGLKGKRETGGAALVAALPYTRRRSSPASSTEKRPARGTRGRGWWMHYRHDERSAGGLEQKEETPPPLLTSVGGAVTSTFHIHRDSCMYPRECITSRTIVLRAHRFRLIRTRGCFYKGGSNRRLPSDVLARMGTGRG